MIEKNLSEEAKNTIQNYLHLPITGHDISCPYFNNRRRQARGALRVLVGKGSADDIAQEVRILSLREKIDLKNLTNEQLKQFLVDRHIGIDCSALAYYILDAELQARNEGSLRKHLRWPNGGIMRRLLRKLRTVENTNVNTFADERNSAVVPLQEIQPGDFITMLGFGQNHDRDHILIVHETHPTSDIRHPTSVYYTHSLQWLSDGKYNHGVRQGQIDIIDSNKPLIDQAWTELNATNERNETWQHAKDSRMLEIRRLRALA